MIYGNAEAMGMPWETVIKVYRDRLRNKALRKLNNYAYDFLFSLVHDYESSPKRQRDNVYWTSRDFFERVLDRAYLLREQSIGDNAEISQDDAVEAAYRTWSHAVEDARILYGFGDIDSAELRVMYADEIGEAYRVVFEGVTKKNFLDLFVSTACEALRRRQFSDSSSGLVFSGFGDAELFPAMKSYALDGVVAGRLRGMTTSKHAISDSTTAYIRPFAQDEMVIRFMEGIDPDYRVYLQHATHVFAQDLVSTIIDSYGKGTPRAKTAIKRDLSKLVEESVEEMIRNAAEYRQEYFVAPITGMAQMLPKEDLANLAESLVNLTSLKRRMSLDEESVGGPIDVAVISKGDGFIWIKRKHYFSVDLNKTFMENYFRRYITGEGETGHDRHAKRTTAARQRRRRA